MQNHVAQLGQIAFLAVSGSLGVLSRYGVDQLFLKLSAPFPVGTLTINVLGSFLAGVVYVIGIERGALPPELRTALMVGFLGGFTTFSAYSLQAARLLEENLWGPMLTYLVISPALGLGASLLGIRITRSLLS